MAMSENAGEQEIERGSGRKRQRNIMSAAPADQVLSPPQHDVNNEPDVTSPPASRRRVGLSWDASSPRPSHFSFCPAFPLHTTHSPSVWFNFDTPSSHVGVAATPEGGTHHSFQIDLGRCAHRPREVLTDPMTGEPISTGLTSEGAPEACFVIWRTDVHVQETRKRFKEFLESFVDDQSEDDIYRNTDADQPYYMPQSEEVNAEEEPFLNVNYDHLGHFNAYSQLVQYPQAQADVVPAFNFSTNEFAHPAGPSMGWF